MELVHYVEIIEQDLEVILLLVFFSASKIDILYLTVGVYQKGRSGGLGF